MTNPTPTESPATVDAVAGWLGVTADNVTERDHIATAVAAVNTYVRTFHDEPADGAPWPPNVVLGSVILSARITRRRNSPAGVEFVGDMGATYVSRYVDPEVEYLLGLGRNRRIVVG